VKWGVMGIFTIIGVIVVVVVVASYFGIHLLR
jgi:CHASE3 domain sensor protein